MTKRTATSANTIRFFMNFLLSDSIRGSQFLVSRLEDAPWAGPTLGWAPISASRRTKAAPGLLSGVVVFHKIL